MSNYFNNPDDLRMWVQQNSSNGDSNTVFNKLKHSISLINNSGNILHEQSLKDCCETIVNGGEDNAQSASEMLYGILASNKLVKMQKTSCDKSLVKTSQSYRSRNKWNRMVEGFQEGTPWRVQRDAMYDFTHYASDLVKFDLNPDHVYSGEAIWRNHIMDKYYREYQNEEGKFVGGYINDRFYVFPDAGTPSNPDAPRDGGNPMGLPNGVKTREPRPSEYSMERRLEENRGNKTESLKSSFANSNAKNTYGQLSRRISIASTLPKEIHEDSIYNVFNDAIGMAEDGLGYADSVIQIAEHYELNPVKVGQVVAFARKSMKKHAGIGYEFKVTASEIKKKRYVINSDLFAKKDDGSQLKITEGESIVEVGNNRYLYNKMTISISPSDLNKLLEVDIKKENNVIIPEDTGIND